MDHEDVRRVTPIGRSLPSLPPLPSLLSLAGAFTAVFTAAFTAATLTCAVAAPRNSNKTTKAKTSAPAPATAVREPRRLTAGTDDQFLATLAPDNQTLYFVSNRNATAQLFAKDLATGKERLVFDDGADISFPRISPDGERVLYVSSRDDAGGDVCLRHLATGNRRCFTGPGTAEIQALWFPDGRSIAVLGRKGLHGDLRLKRVKIGLLTSAGQTLVDANLSGPALSSDGKWLAWLPIQRASKDVGISFAMKATGGLALRAISGGKVQNLRFKLPGVTGFAAFSHDDRWLYFTQYLSDTNFDGRIDGGDNAVLFRSRFSAGAKRPVDTESPEQLTSARHNCQYPQPSASRLIMTCSVGGSLDIFELPLDGAVAQSWDTKKLDEALQASRDRWLQLMLLHRKWTKSRTSDGRRRALVELVRAHLALGEHASAAFFAELVGRQPSKSAKKSKARKAWSAAVVELVGARREARLLNRGELNDTFIKRQRARLWRLAMIGKGAPRDVRALVQLTMLEIHDVIGEEKRALAALNGVDLAKLEDPLAVQLYASSAVDLLLATGQKKTAISTLLAVAQHPALRPIERIAGVDKLLRVAAGGRDKAQRKRTVADLRKRVKIDSDAAFALELEAKLLQLEPDDPDASGPGKDAKVPPNAEKVRALLFQHYRYHREFARRRTLVAKTMEAGARVNSGYLMYQFANTWISMVSRKHAERPLAEQLFRQVVLERAYIDWDKRNYGDARGHFYGVTLQTDDLEAHIGFVEARQREGKHDALQIYQKRFARQPDHPVLQFVQAYIAASSLPQLDASARRDAVDTATTHLRLAAAALQNSAVLHHLRAYLAHQRFILDGDKELAVAAHTDYLLALDLARGNARQRACTLHALGLLQAAVGNHHIAIDYLDRRMLLPVERPESALNLAMARARSLFHIGKTKRAHEESLRGLTMARQNPLLARFVGFAADQTALYAWAAGAWDEAAKLYASDVLNDAKATPGNKVRAAMMAGASELAANHPDAALRHLHEAGKHLRTTDMTELNAGAVPWRKTPRTKPEDLQLVIDGLLAQAQVAKGRLDEAEASLHRRVVILRKRLSGTEADGALIELAVAQHDRAELLHKAGKTDAAAALLVDAIDLTDKHAARTGTGNHKVRVRVALAYAALHLHGKIDAQRIAKDPASVLEVVHNALSRRPNPARAAERFTVGTTLALLRVNNPPKSAGVTGNGAKP